LHNDQPGLDGGNGAMFSNEVGLTDISSIKEDQQESRDAEQQRWAETRRTEVRLVIWIVSVLILSTAYFTCLNAYVLVKAEPRPFYLAFDHPASLSNGAYSIALTWSPMDTSESLVRPQLLLDGTTDLASMDGRATLGQSYTVQIRVPANTTPGVHVGSINMHQIGTIEDLPDSFPPIPVTIEVTGGFWNSWFLLRDWLIFVVALGLILYGFCVLNFPKPSGFLIVSSGSDGSAPPRKVALRMRKIALLLPWRRSSIPLAALWKEARFSLPLKTRGEVFFLFDQMPVLFTMRRQRSYRFEKTISEVGMVDSYDIPDEAFLPCGRIDIMYTHNLCRYGNGSDQSVLLRYSKKMISIPVL